MLKPALLLASLLTATMALAECPTRDDLKDGVVLLRSDGRSPVHIRQTDDTHLWIAHSKTGRAPVDRPDNFIMVNHLGVLPAETTAGWDEWEALDDLSAILDLGVMETIEIESRVKVWDQAEPKRGIATFRHMRTREHTFGDCTYQIIDFGARTEVFEADGTSKKMPGYFYYVPELMIALDGMWDGDIRQVTGMRKGTAEDWFGG